MWKIHQCKGKEEEIVTAGIILHHMSFRSRAVKEVSAPWGISSFPTGYLPPDWACLLLLCLHALSCKISKSCSSAAAWSEKRQSKMVSGAPLSTVHLQQSLERLWGINLHPAAQDRPALISWPRGGASFCIACPWKKWAMIDTLAVGKMSFVVPFCIAFLNLPFVLSWAPSWCSHRIPSHHSKISFLIS